MEDIRINTRMVMILKNISIDDLAKALELPREDVSRFLDGELLLSPIGLSKVYRCLGVTKSFLLTNHRRGIKWALISKLFLM